MSNIRREALLFPCPSYHAEPPRRFFVNWTKREIDERRDEMSRESNKKTRFWDRFTVFSDVIFAISGMLKVLSMLVLACFAFFSGDDPEA